MIFENVELHNVDCVEKGEHGYVMFRVPNETREKLNTRARDLVSRYTTGVEIRFVMNSDKAVLKLYVKGQNKNRFLPCQLFYGGIYSGWLWYDPVNLNDGLNEIIIDKGYHERRTYSDRPPGPVGLLRHRLRVLLRL